MHDHSVKFKIGLAFTASRLYELEPNGSASAISGYAAWADTLEDVRNNLQRLATAPRTATSEETYLISAKTDKCNAQIRGGPMNIKARLATEQGVGLCAFSVAHLVFVGHGPLSNLRLRTSRRFALLRTL
jgi:hypothetical protein